MARTLARGRTINLLSVMIDERLHPDSAHIEHVTLTRTRGAATGLGGPVTDTAAAAPDAWLETRRWYGREIDFWGANCRPAMRGRHSALTGEAAESVQGWRAGRGVTALAIVGEAGDMWCVGGEIDAAAWDFRDWCRCAGAVEGAFALWNGAGPTLCDANRVTDWISAERGCWWCWGSFLLWDGR